MNLTGRGDGGNKELSVAADTTVTSTIAVVYFFTDIYNKDLSAVSRLYLKMFTEILRIQILRLQWRSCLLFGI